MNAKQLSLGERLGAFMGKHDMTIDDVAKEIERNPRTVWTILHGLHEPNVRTAYRVKKLMGETA